MRPEQILGENDQSVRIIGRDIRKGSIAALLASWRDINEPGLAAAARDQARSDLLALVPAVAAAGLFEVFMPRDPALADLIDQALAAQARHSSSA
ncbi:hypothetical protein [Chitinimonas sp.]|uniref:hypothetical protein n=1 Tax=Chitinimonas sp. TaxID=1934313 RepID=UPI0035B0FF85